VRPPYGRLLEFKKSKLIFLKNTFCAKKMSHAGCPGPSPVISAQFTCKMCVAAKIARKLTKNPYFGGSKLFQFIDVDTNKRLSLLLVMIINMSVHVYNRFHATQDNCGKITTFRGG